VGSVFDGSIRSSPARGSRSALPTHPGQIPTGQIPTGQMLPPPSTSPREVPIDLSTLAHAAGEAVTASHAPHRPPRGGISSPPPAPPPTDVAAFMVIM
jgi:hypothetical protein